MTHLIIIKGEKVGQECTVPAAGMRVGRSHANDLVLSDEALSQFHCRFFFKSDQALWVTDFASTNHTLVNEVPVTEKKLEIGDTIELGNEAFRVVHNTIKPGAEPAAPAPLSTDAPAPARPVFDLGFGAPPAEANGFSRKRVLRWVGAAAVALLLAVGARVAMRYAQSDQQVGQASSPQTPPLTVHYEKVEGSEENIFRYALRIENNELHVQIDDIKNRRHVAREKKLDEDVLRQLTEALRAASFETLQSEYIGVSPGLYHLWDLTVVIGREARHVRVLNRLEPEEFKRVREMIEEYGRAELGLAALALTPERLMQLAQQAYLNGSKRYEEREVRYGNLSESVRQYLLAIWYLETIEPKPSYYPETVHGLERSRQELDRRYQDLMFRADQAVKLKDWEEAAQHLRIMMELIPDRSDDRNRKAETQLLTVERYLRR